MATDVYSGLFGSPLSQQELQNQLIEQRAGQMSGMGLGQMGAYLGYKGGAQLGGGLAGLMGKQITDPVVQKAITLRQLAGGIDPTTAEGLKEYANRLSQAGFKEEAAKISEKVREAALKEAQVEKVQGKYGATTASERNRELIQAAEVKLAQGQPLDAQEEARVRWLVSQETKPKVFRDSETGEIIKVDPLDISTAAPNLASLLGKKGVSEGGITSTGPTKIAPSIRKEVGDVDQQLVDIEESIKKVESLIPSIEKVDLGLQQNIERGVRGFFGRPTADTKAFKELKRETLKQANNLLLLAKGTQTEGDAQRAKDQIADEDTWKNKELLTDAFIELASTLQKTKSALSAKRTTLTTPGIPESPVTPTTVAQPKQATPLAATAEQRVSADIAGLEREIKNTNPNEKGRLAILQDELAKARKSQENLKTKKTIKWSDLP